MGRGISNNTGLFYIALTLVVMIIIMPAQAFAGNPIGNTLCAVVGWFHVGNVGFGLAVISLFIMAIAACMNKITWGMFIIGTIDVVILFSAADLVLELGGVNCNPF